MKTRVSNSQRFSSSHASLASKVEKSSDEIYDTCAWFYCAQSEK